MNYDYNFNEYNESIKEEFFDMAVDIKNKRHLLNIIITDKNILFFYDANKNHPLRYKVFLPSEYELVLKISFAEIELDNKPTKNDSQILVNNQIIIIYNLDLNKYM